MDEKKTGFKFHMRFADINRISDLIESMAKHFEDLNIPAKISYELQLVLEEAVSNILIHGYGRKPGFLEIGFDYENEIVKITLEDKAKPFNLLSAPKPDMSCPPEEREIGGLGVHLIKELTDKIIYEYSDGKNILTLIKSTGEKKL
ncbi:ATP-binding protein [Methanoplanus sp. FWC-SCC4]|uniref:ATP-binding protein n=1 Tax=Methanochimaera problematica TaxID=2609417 RepID=A0AA97I2K6_9EURY|nr:ATP-binding protein [Methanoplanus sp. FWC-SCC4]WOF16380.1 ATP-binding protein [Methanoplanus sp. FWC-SCC4]